MSSSAKSSTEPFYAVFQRFVASYEKHPLQDEDFHFNQVLSMLWNELTSERIYPIHYYAMQQVARSIELHPLTPVAHAQPPGSSESEGEEQAEPYWKKYRDQASAASQKARKCENLLRAERTNSNPQ
jgi:hypothetical protein